MTDADEYSHCTLGEEVKHVFLVGLVRDLCVDEDSDKWSFKLDDGTGN